MYVEDKAGTDITVSVEDEEYDAEAVVDVDSDGVDETAVVQRDDGSALAFSDTDGDGRADLMTQLDATGEVTGQAEYDPGSGDWIGVEPSTGDGTGTVGGSSEQISVDTPDGEIAAGPATHDTDGDGVNDSVVVVGDDGDATIFTDIDGDGSADVATEITAAGEVTVTEHVGDGEWTVVERGRIDDEGSYQSAEARDGEDCGVSDGWGDDGPARRGSAVSVDPATGRWTPG